MSELAKEMLKRGIASPFDLTEEDKWVNNATRKDVENVAREHNSKVFGLKFWSWKKKRGKELLDVKNFEVDLIFKDEDEAKVDKIISEYENGKKDTVKTINELFDLAILDCFWV